MLSLAFAPLARADDVVDSIVDTVADDEPRPRAETRILQLIDQLRDDDRWKVRVEAAMILGRSGDFRVRQPLTRALTDPHYAVRAAAIRSLTNLGDIRDIRALLDGLGDDEPFVRSEARRAIDSFDLEIARPYFVHALRRHPDPNVRLAAAERLAEAPDETSLAALLDAIGADDQVGRFAVSALRARSESEAIALFLRGLGEADYAVQIASMRALADLGAARATDPVIALLDSEVPEVTFAAVEALRALSTHVDRGKWLVLAKRAPSRFERARALKVLGIIGGEEAAVLVLNALDDDDVLVRGAAVNAIANLQELRAIPKLEEMKKLEVNGRIRSLVRGTLSNLQRLRQRGKSDAKQPS